MDFYHVLNRGVEKRDIVLDDGDRMRFVQSLYVFNDSNPTPNAVSQKSSSQDLTRDRDLLVHIHSWCLMSNHYHILLTPVGNDPLKLSLFMKKLNGGYAKFFNEKYARSGYLWQGKYRKILIAYDSHFTYIPYYIHLNPLDVAFNEWREGGVKDTELAIKTLDEYRWSSWQDYNGLRNFPSLIHTHIMSEILGTSQDQREKVESIISDKQYGTKSVLIEN